MQKSKNENLKKLVTALVVLTLFVVSFYYYAPGKKEVKLAEKPGKILQGEIKRHPRVKLPPAEGTPASNVILTEASRSRAEESQTVTTSGDPSTPLRSAQDDGIKIEIKELKPEKIKPSNIKDLIANAMETSGKKDPFSYRESSFNPITGGSSGGSEPGLAGLPMPPMSPDFLPDQLQEPVVVKGFLGNKVIAEIKGFTESLAVNESLQGIKVLKVDSANLTCVFQIDGKRVTKTIKPITIPDKNVELNYIHN